jgi:hypothetical protein
LIANQRRIFAELVFGLRGIAHIEIITGKDSKPQRARPPL